MLRRVHNSQRHCGVFRSFNEPLLFYFSCFETKYIEAQSWKSLQSNVTIAVIVGQHRYSDICQNFVAENRSCFLLTFQCYLLFSVTSVETIGFESCKTKW